MTAYSIFHSMVGREITGVKIDGKSYSIDDLRAALSVQPPAAVVGEPVAWYREGFTFNFSLGSKRPKNNTSNPDEWKPLYAAPSAPEGWQLEWRLVVGWEDHYEVSNTGRMRKKGGEPIGQWPNTQGYMLARLSNPRAVVRVHRSVADAFIPNPDNLPFVNHVDNDRAHNCDLNLEWCTQKENLDHSRRQGRMPDNYWVGKRSPNASIDDDIVAEIRRLYASGDHSYQALGEKFGISKRAIGRLINRETYADV